MNTKKNRSITFEIVENSNISNYEELIKRNEGTNMSQELINYALEHFFNEGSIIHKYNSNILLVRVKIADLLNAPIINWCQNRDPDMIRIPDIASYIYHKQKPIETILYLSFNYKKQKFDIIDGIHRYMALKYIKEKNSIISDNSNDHEFGCNSNASWLYNSDIILNIRFNADTGELITLREILNKTQPMATVLMNDMSTENLVRKDIIEKIATEWQIKYTKNFSSSNDESYMKTNGVTNRTNFITLLGIIYEKYNIDISRINILRQVLEEGNLRMKEKVNLTNMGSSKARLRCRETGCYLFMYKNNQLEDFL
jgi:hypothetical protein